MQTKLREETAKKINMAADIISYSFTWAGTDEGHKYWDDVVMHLRKKAASGTSDGKPYVEPEPPIPEGWRKANADEWTRKDVKCWNACHKEWRPRKHQGTVFDPPVMQRRYIVPIDLPLTDQDAAVWPRLKVMVRDEDHEPWRGPVSYLGKSSCQSLQFVVDSEKYGDRVWEQARRATPEEIEAANGNS